ncbi:MAG: phage scaffolding protein [Methylobacter sp.]
MSAPEITPTPAPKPTPATPETFSREYVTELREENKSHRLARQEAEQKAQAAEEAAQKAKDEAEAHKAELQSKADQRIIRAELKAEAIKAGMIDLDGLKLADLSAIKLDENGEVIGADELMKTLKESKPYLFKAVSTSNTETPPKPGETQNKKATEMTAEEANAAAKAAGVSSFKFKK